MTGDKAEAPKLLGLYALLPARRAALSEANIIQFDSENIFAVRIPSVRRR